MSAEAEEAPQGVGKATRALVFRNSAAQLLSLGKSLVILPLVAPAELGTYSLVMTLAAHTGFMHLGVLTTFRIQFPARHGAGDPEACAQLQGMALRATLFGCMLAAAYLFVVAKLIAGLSTAEASVCLIGGAAFLGHIYVRGSYEVRAEFGKQARVDLATMGFGFVGALVGAALYGGYGLIVATLLAPALALPLGREFFTRGVWRGAVWTRERLRLSARYFTTDALHWLTAGIDLVLLGWLLGRGGALIGLYAFGRLIANLVNKLSVAVPQAQAVFFLRSHGAKSGWVAHRDVHDLMLRDTWLTLSIAACAGVGVSALTPVFIPAYVASVAALPQFLLAPVVRRWGNYPSLQLKVRGMTFWPNVALLVGGAGCAVATVWGLNHGLAGLGWAVAVGYALAATVLLVAGHVVAGGARALPAAFAKLTVLHAPLGLWFLDASAYWGGQQALYLVAPVISLVLLRIFAPTAAQAIWTLGREVLSRRRPTRVNPD